VAAWALGWLLSDRFLWSQFLAWIPTPLVALWLGGGTLLLTLAWLARRRSGALAAATAVLMLLLVALSVLTEHRPFAAVPASPAGDRSLRLLHCNLHWPGRLVAPRALDIVRDRPEDILVFTDPGWLLHDGRESELAAAGWNSIRIGRYAVLSRLPYVEFRTLVGSRGTDVTLLRVDASSKGMGVLALGLVDMPSSLRHPRMAWAAELHGLLNELQAPEFNLVVGDFNATRGSASIARLFPELRHAWEEAGRGWGASYSTTLPLWHIDHVLLAPSLTAVDYTLLDLGLSAHFAQVVIVVPARAEPGG
jgi:endonuclease/exonuclease/phosphatase (EEP) superfamily protein YafD